MSVVDEKLSKFSKIVLEDANSKKEQILSQAKIEKANELDKDENEIYAQAYRDIQTAVQSALKKKNELVSKVLVDNKRKLFIRRDEVLKSVMSDVKKKIVEYCTTDEYERYFHSIVKMGMSSFSGKNVSIQVSAKDMRFSQSVREQFGVELCQSSDVGMLGGAIIECLEDNMVLDLSLATKLREQQGYLIELSGLSIIDH